MEHLDPGLTPAMDCTMTRALATIDHEPRIFIKDGVPCTNSRDVAKKFDKRHDNVVRDIRSLVSMGVLNFEETPYVNAQNGETYTSYDMNRDAFSVLCMGFTGTKAVRWKMDYVKLFNAMEEELASRPTAVAVAPARPVIDLDDTDFMVALSATLLSKNQELQAWKVAATPAVQFAERVSASSTTFWLTDACKLLELKPKAGIQAMSDAGLIYRRTPGAPWVASQPALDKGWFKPVIIEREAFTGSQTRVTGKGLVAIAGKIGSSLTQLEIHNRLTALSRQPDLLTAA